MIAIVISACLAGNPDVCKDHRIPLMNPMNELQCTFFAQQHFARWAQEHPGWKIKAWHCVDTSEDDI